jgi:hypothetical protein
LRPTKQTFALVKDDAGHVENLMTLDSMLAVFLTGLAGGVVLEILHWYALRKASRWPAYAKSPIYWLVSLAMALVGGGLAVLYFGSHAEGIVALHVGLSAPLILQKLATTIAQPGAKSADNVIGFFHW